MFYTVNREPSKTFEYFSSIILKRIPVHQLLYNVHSSRKHIGVTYFANICRMPCLFRNLFEQHLTWSMKWKNKHQIFAVYKKLSLVHLVLSRWRNDTKTQWSSKLLTTHTFTERTGFKRFYTTRFGRSDPRMREVEREMRTMDKQQLGNVVQGEINRVSVWTTWHSGEEKE